MQALTPAVAAVFDPVQTATTFEETVERLGTAIRLGLLEPGAKLPPERDLADQLGIARSTLRQALTALTESGHLLACAVAAAGPSSAAAPPMAESTHVELDGGHWREVLDNRVAVEVGAVVLAAERAAPDDLARLHGHVVRDARGRQLHRLPPRRRALPPRHRRGDPLDPASSRR